MAAPNPYFSAAPQSTACPNRPRLSPKDLNSVSTPFEGPSTYFSIGQPPPSSAFQLPTPSSHSSTPQTPFDFNLSLNTPQSAKSHASNPFSPPAGVPQTPAFEFGKPLGGPSSGPMTPRATGSSGASQTSTPPFNLKLGAVGALRGPPAAHSGSSTPLGPPPASPFIPSGASNPAPSAAASFNFRQPMAPPRLPAGLGGPISRPHLPAASNSAVSSSLSARFPPLAPTALLDLFASLPAAGSAPAIASAGSPLVLDIRTHTSYLSSRLSGSLNICVPSTLLRRPAYGIDRVAESLHGDEQVAFGSWSQASTIVVLDADSIALSEGNGVAALLAKFEKAGFGGQLGWIKGGWGAVRSEARRHDSTKGLIVSGELHPQPLASPMAPPPAGFAGFQGAIPPTPGVGGLTSPKKHARPVLQVRDLPVSAFQQATTSTFVHSGQPTGGGFGHGQGGAGSNESNGSGRPGMGKRRKSGNAPNAGLNLDLPPLGMRGMNSVTQDQLGVNQVLKTPYSDTSTPGAGMTGEKRMATNPFFDNIRQNTEALSLSRSLANLSPVDLPTIKPEVLPSLPAFLSRLILLPPLERALLLARQFYDLEVAERERLEGTLNYHANIQGTANEDDTDEAKQFKKFGISAGVELGDLNRFKNIFPYEHARVKIKGRPKGATDYINASHIGLAGSAKRFIASQGPLPTTFSDFWQVCAQEKVGVIIMLTNLHEGGREKCARYWVNRSDCQWDVHTEGGGAADDDLANGNAPGGGGFFGPAPTSSESAEDAVRTVRRTITVRRKADPVNAAPLKLRHIHYRAWPDFDIPAKPEDLVALVKEVEQAQRDYMREVGWRPEENGGLEEPPVLAHCSAGVGRTGVFIMVSTMLEKLRRERTAARAQRAAEKDSMEVDGGDAAEGSPSGPPIPSPSSAVSDTAHISASLRAQTLDSSPAPSPTAFNFTPNASAADSGSARTTPDATRQAEELASTRAVKAAEPAPPSDGEKPALEGDEPVFDGTNEMREQRMSMIANYRQYVCVHECVLAGAMQEMEEEERGAAAAA